MLPKPLRQTGLYIRYILLGIVISVGLLLIGVNNLLAPMAPANFEAIPVRVTIPAGSSGAQIAKILADKGLIKSELLFRLLVRKEGVAQDLKAGEYQLSPTLTPLELINKLTTGDVISDYVRVTIPEGYTVKQITDLLEAEGLIQRERFLQLVQEGDFPFSFIDKIPADVDYRLEGYLFPDTYHIDLEMDEKAIIQLMLQRFDQVISETRINELASQLDMTLHEAVTLASIVEKEAKLPEERAVIAGVFHNRLEKGMMLGSCATIQYILGEPKARLLTSDTQIPSPYNTYLHTGLPPGPIAMPGKDSLLAAVKPAETEYYYFRARDDGSHYFTKTLAEHNRAAGLN